MYCRGGEIRASLAAVMLLSLGMAGQADESSSSGSGHAVELDWRGCAVLRPPVFEKDGQTLTLSELIVSGVEVWRKSPPDQPMIPAPSRDWVKPDFDDKTWALNEAWLFPHRQEPVGDKSGDWRRRQRQHYLATRYGVWSPPYAPTAVLCARGRFEVEDPGRIKTLRFSLEFRGGAVVYLNGTETGRSHLPNGDIDTDTVADPYPTEAHSDKLDEKLECRIRTLECAIPANLVRKGMNVLAVGVHRAPLAEKYARGRGWATAGLVSLNLHSDIPLSGSNSSAAIPLFRNHSVLLEARETDRFIGRPVEPIRIIGARNGAFSGQILVNCADGADIKRATIGSLSDEKGSTIPGAAIRVRYALPRRFGTKSTAGWGGISKHHDPSVFEILSDVPFAQWPQGPEKDKKPLKIQPVWITVRIPPDTAPGTYRGNLAVTVEGRNPETIPVALEVGACKLPDSCDYRSFIDVVQSPESLAMKYDTPLYGEKNWEMIDRSWELLGGMGNTFVYIPIITKSHFGNSQGMVRWIRDPDGGYRHDFSQAERYLDTVLKYNPKPRVVCLYVWDQYCNPAGSGRRPNLVKFGPPTVSLLDPATGRITEMEAPAYTDPAAAEFWKPVAEGLLAIARKRGLEHAVTVGMASDISPAKGVMVLWKSLLPDAGWVCRAHGAYPLEGKGYGCFVFSMRYPLDPSIERGYNWPPERAKFKAATAYVYRLWRASSATLGHARFMNDLIITGGSSGGLDAHGDFVPSAYGLGGMVGDLWDIVGRFHMGNYGGTSLAFGAGHELLQAGATGPVATATLEMFREGIQETEARLIIGNALADANTRQKWGVAKAEHARDFLDTRLRHMLWTGVRAVRDGSTEGLKWIAESGKPECRRLVFRTGTVSTDVVMTLWGGGMGMEWYDASGWQERAGRLFATAAEAQALSREAAP